MRKKLYLCTLISIIIGIIVGGCQHKKHHHYDDEEEDDDIELEIVKAQAKGSPTKSPEEKLPDKGAPEEKITSSETLNLKGEMGGFPITLDLTIKDGKVSGKYYNVTYKVTFKVKGTVSDGMYDLTLTHGKSVVSMTLYSSGANSFIGEATAESKTLSVNLKRR